MSLTIGELVASPPTSAFDALVDVLDAIVEDAQRRRVLTVGHLVGGVLRWLRRAVHGVRRLVRAARSVGTPRPGSLAAAGVRGPPAVI